MPALTSHQVKNFILKQLPLLIKKDAEMKTYIIELIEKTSAPKKQTEDRFELLLKETHAVRDENQKKWEAWEKKWAEEKTESQKKWEENQKKWKEDQKRWDENMAELKSLHRKYDQGVGAIGSRWGFQAEETFRNAIGGILSEISEYKVKHFEQKDEEGFVFHYPQNVELDIIIHNGKLFLAEIKSSMDGDQMRLFKRKAQWYEKMTNRKPEGLLVISPMIHPKAWPVAQSLGIRCFSYAEDVAL